MIRYLTAGESHGQALVGILEGMPAGLEISEAEIAVDLRRRQLGYGRGERMKIEKDHARILTGVRYGKTLGSPIALLIENKDWPNWKDIMSVETQAGQPEPPLTTPRPGHADYAGALKYRHKDIRNVIERSSARETAMRVALAAVCRKFFACFDIAVASHVIRLGGIESNAAVESMTAAQINEAADASPLRCLDKQAEKLMIGKIDRAKSDGDTLGGVFEVVMSGVPVGLGSCMHSDRRLDAVLAKAMMSIPAVKAVGFGDGEFLADRPGSQVHDELFLSEKSGVTRRTNHAGGVEGGMSNGEMIRIRAAMKPLPTLGQPLKTVDLATGKSAQALRERSDVCAVPAAAVIGEAVALLALMNPFLEKIGGDSIEEIREHFNTLTEHP